MLIAWRSLAHEDYFGNTSALWKGTDLLLGHARTPGDRDARTALKAMASGAPDLYSVRLVEEAPAPAIVPPVESTQTSGSSFFPASWLQQGVLPATQDASTAVARLLISP
jgi:hypothetical protein